MKIVARIHFSATNPEEIQERIYRLDEAARKKPLNRSFHKELKRTKRKYTGVLLNGCEFGCECVYCTWFNTSRKSSL